MICSVCDASLGPLAVQLSLAHGKRYVTGAHPCCPPGLLGGGGCGATAAPSSSHSCAFREASSVLLHQLPLRDPACSHG